MTSGVLLLAILTSEARGDRGACVSSAAMWLIFGGSTIGNGQVAEAVRSCPELLDDDLVRADVESRLVGLDGRRDGLLVAGAAGQRRGPLLINDAVDNLALVTAYATSVLASGGRPRTSTLAYVRSYVAAADVAVAPDLTRWLGRRGQAAFARDYADARELGSSGFVRARRSVPGSTSGGQ